MNAHSPSFVMGYGYNVWGFYQVFRWEK